MRYIYFVIFLMASHLATAQMSAHRIFQTDLANDTVTVIQDAILIPMGETVVMSFSESPGPSVVHEELFLSKFDAMTNGGLSLQITTSSQADQEIKSFVSGSLAYNDKSDLIDISFVALMEDDTYEVYVGNCTTGLDNITLKKMDKDAESELPNFAFTASQKRSILAFQQDDNTITLDKLNEDIDRLWSNTYDFGQPIKLASTFNEFENNIIISGNIGADEERFFISEIDTLGGIIQAKSYAVSESVNIVNTLNRGDNKLLVGNADDRGYLMMVDSIGDVIWSKTLDIAGDLSYISNVDTLKTDFLLSGIYRDVDKLRHFTMVVDDQSNIKNTTIYQNDSTDLVHNVSPVDYDGMTGKYVLAGSLYSKYSPNKVASTIMWHDESFMANCSEALKVDSLFPKEVTVDTLVFTRAEAMNNFEAFQDSIIFKNPFSIPTLSVDPSSKKYCKDETINELLTANVNGVDDLYVEYEWTTTGDKTKTYTAMEVGQFPVTAKVTYEECYTLMSSATLEYYEDPAVSAVGGPIIQCELDSIVASINSVGSGEISLSWDFNGQPYSDELGFSTDQEGAYTVTLTDTKCNLVSTDTYNVRFNEPLKGYEFSYEVDCESEEERQLSLFLSLDGEAESAKLSNLAGGNPFNLIDQNGNIVVPGEKFSVGNYNLVITDLCNNTWTEEIETSGRCNTCIEYPNVFFPNGEVDIEKTFGPVTVESCEGTELAFESYEFRIFNRWGQEVFSTEDPSQAWNGRYNDKNAPSEVYVFYAIFTIEGQEEQKVKGDVTLVR